MAFYRQTWLNDAENTCKGSCRGFTHRTCQLNGAHRTESLWELPRAPRDPIPGLHTEPAVPGSPASEIFGELLVKVQFLHSCQVQGESGRRERQHLFISWIDNGKPFRGSGGRKMKKLLIQWEAHFFQSGQQQRRGQKQENTAVDGPDNTNYSGDIKVHCSPS